MNSLVEPTLLDNSLLADAVGADKAAEILGVSKRSVFRYAKRGLLKRLQSDGSTYFVRADILRLALEIKNGRLRRTSTLRSLVLQERLQEAANAMELVTFGLDAQCSPLSLNDDEMHSLFLSAQNFAKSGWPPGSERQWVLILLGLRPENIRQIESMSQLTDAWVPFLTLARKLEQAVADTPLAMLCYAAHTHVLVVAKQYIAAPFGSQAWKRELRSRAGVDRNQLRRATRAKQTRRCAAPIDDIGDVNQQLRDALAAFAQERARLKPA